MGSWTVHTSNRLDVLLAHLAERLAEDPLPPLVEEMIVVPGQAMSRWVRLELARAHGIAGGLALPFPGSYLESLSSGGGEKGNGAFGRDALALRLFRLLGDEALRPSLGAAAAYCRDDVDQRKRWQLASALAQCFDEYQLHQPELLRGFADGRTPKGAPDAEWQMRLWRELLREVPADVSDGAVRLLAFDRALQQGGLAAKRLPRRLSIFGVASLPAPLLQRYVALSDHVDVTVYAVRPTAMYFGDVARKRGGAANADARGPVLLEAFGKQSREFFDLVLDQDAGDSDQPLDFVDPGEDTLLHALQSDVLNLRDRRAAGDAPPLQLARDDASLRVHSTHGMLREMEVVRDQLLAAFTDLPDLSPEHVLVLLPDVQAYAPYVEAAFAPFQQLLRVRVADRDPAADRASPRVLLALFDLPARRFAASSVLSLLDDDAVARRFSIARSQVPLLHEFVDRASVRWGLDGERKKRDHDLPAENAHTWQEGLDRLVLGLATGPLDLPVLGALPVADRTSGRTALLAGLCAFLEAVRETTELLASERTLDEWARVVDDLCERFFLPQGDHELAAVAPLREASRRLRELHAITSGAEPVRMSSSAVRAWLDDRFASLGDARGFLGGQITVAALRPMRTVPMRVIAIGGLHDGSFPRGDQRHEFDLLADDRRPGARSRRDEDRQTFLDALLAAKDRVILSYVGRSAKDNSECAPSTVLAELLDHVDAAFVPADGFDSARAQVVVDHPLQSFSPRYGADDARLFGYATGSVARPATPDAAPAATAERAPAESVVRLELDDLVRFWRHPQRDWCHRALDASFPADEEAPEESEPFALEALGQHAAVTQFVRLRLLGASERAAEAAVQASGVLPPGPLGRVALDGVLDRAAKLADRVRAERTRGDRTHRLELRVDGFELTGDLTGLQQSAMVLWQASAWRDKHALRAWVLHVAMSVAAADGASLPVETRLHSPHGVHRLRPLENPLAQLTALLEGFRRGTQAPLPSPLFASWAFAHTLSRGRDDAEQAAWAAARSAYEPDDAGGPHDLPDPAISLCFRGVDPLQDPEFARWARDVHLPAVLAVGEPTASDTEPDDGGAEGDA